MKQHKPKIDWDTVELLGELVRAPVAPPKPAKRPVLVPVTVSVQRADLPATPMTPPTPKGSPDPRPKMILSGASAKARALGPSHTHTQLRKIIPAGIETFIYGWWLLIAAIESDSDLSRGVEIAAHAVFVTSQRFMQKQ